jgi:hypothetical protein
MVQFHTFMLYMVQRLEGATSSIDLDIIEPLDLFKDNFVNQSLADLKQAKVNSANVDDLRNRVETIK